MSHADTVSTAGTDEASAAPVAPAPVPAPAPAAPAASSSKSKGKGGKKLVDSAEASKLLAARISQLEQEHVGEKEQEAEIGT